MAGWILELDRGQGIPFQGNYSEWLESRQKRLSSEKKEQASLQRSLAEELEWFASTPVFLVPPPPSLSHQPI